MGAGLGFWCGVCCGLITVRCVWVAVWGLGFLLRCPMHGAPVVLPPTLNREGTSDTPRASARATNASAISVNWARCRRVGGERGQDTGVDNLTPQDGGRSALFAAVGYHTPAYGTASSSPPPPPIPEEHHVRTSKEYNGPLTPLRTHHARAPSDNKILRSQIHTSMDCCKRSNHSSTYPPPRPLQPPLSTPLVLSPHVHQH